LTVIADLWIQWLDDEEAAATDDVTVLAVYELYDRAVSDYLCMHPHQIMDAYFVLAIRIWSRYLDFIERHTDVIAKSLEVKPQQFLDLGFKKAIAATQYHISEVIYSLTSKQNLVLIVRANRYGVVKRTAVYGSCSNRTPP
jgi:hypothetical protein